MSFKTWTRRTRRRIPRVRLPYKLRFVILELIYGIALGFMSFLTSFLIAEFSVWVFLQWMLTIERILLLYYFFLALINGMFFFIPIYNRRPIQLMAAVALVAIVHFILLKRFEFDPITTVFGLPNY